MSGYPARAVAASALSGEQAALREMLRRVGCERVICVGDGPSVLERARSENVDFVVADAVLPGLDGAALAAGIEDLSVETHPGLLLLAVPGMCPRAEGCAVAAKPLTEDALVSAIQSLRPERRRAPVRKRALAERTLDAVGVPDHPGRDYLLRAIEIVWLDGRWLRGLTTRLYPAIGREFDRNTRQVERAMRHVIDVAWRGGEMDVQYKIFGDTLDAKRGGPTCGEMIAQIADILRWEGRA